MNLNIAASSIEERRSVLEWRDRHIIAATLALHRACQDAWPLIEARLAAVSWHSVLTETDAFVTREIDPIVAGAVNEAVQRLIREAQLELDHIIEHHLALEATLGGTPVETNKLTSELDLIAGLAPILGSVGIAAALPSFAVVSGAVMFGMVATSAISAPILLTGIAVAGAGLATGVLQTSRIKEKRTARMRVRVRNHIDAAVLNDVPKSTTPSLLVSLTIVIQTAAAAALERIENNAG
ncbi:hypothetical protein F1C10_15695 (plasmid) [Sphingomonas sp. NBWT7]|uniref:hypothetical protein n=1 Tax=Sphingomonas sp. NBWT7 TaxID=2596913 RepID=UPI00162AEB3D|nr:hypothetical protein [Sphingomonas sp. NBWT7]MBS4011716.1 hypothetical protein [Roseovarius sp.]QNE33571.1 hypothetical protein F1C10_15695 [Sphingomonas sp. NBWT7]